MMRMLGSKSLGSATHQMRLIRTFSDSQPNESLRLNKKGVLDMKQLSYRPQEKLEFVDGKCTLYLNKQYWLTNLYLSSHITSSMVFLAYLIKTNPFYLTLPVAVPLMYLAELVLLRRMFFKLKLYKPIVERINLLANGEVIEVVYSNKISRKLKGLPTNEHFWITMLKPAEYTESDIPILHDEFPSSTDAIRPPGPFEYAWIKFYSNCDNHLMIPRRYEFANMEVLVHYAPIQTEVFKGKLIQV